MKFIYQQSFSILPEVSIQAKLSWLLYDFLCSLTVRDIAYHRHPGSPDVTSEHITRHQYDARGFLMQSADPRLHDAGLANFTYLTDLAGNVLCTQGVDNGTTVALTGVPLSVTRRLLKDADSPDTVAGWQGTDASAWNDLLAGEVYTTLITADATGAVLTTTDAKGNLQRVAYDVAGLLSGSWLTVKGGKEQTIVASLTYSAAGQKLREEHGNGVVTTYTYEPETQRLTSIKTERPSIKSEQRLPCIPHRVFRS